MLQLREWPDYRRTTDPQLLCYEACTLPLCYNCCPNVGHLKPGKNLYRPLGFEPARSTFSNVVECHRCIGVGSTFHHITVKSCLFVASFCLNIKTCKDFFDFLQGRKFSFLNQPCYQSQCVSGEPELWYKDPDVRLTHVKSLVVKLHRLEFKPSLIHEARIQIHQAHSYLVGMVF